MIVLMERGARSGIGQKVFTNPKAQLHLLSLIRQHQAGVLRVFGGSSSFSSFHFCEDQAEQTKSGGDRVPKLKVKVVQEPR